MDKIKKSRAALIAEGLQAKMKAIAEKYPEIPIVDTKSSSEYESPEKKMRRLKLSLVLKEYWNES